MRQLHKSLLTSADRGEAILLLVSLLVLVLWVLASIFFGYLGMLIPGMLLTVGVFVFLIATSLVK